MSRRDCVQLFWILSRSDFKASSIASAETASGFHAWPESAVRALGIGIEIVLGQGKACFELPQTVLKFDQLLAVEQINGRELLELGNPVVSGQLALGLILIVIQAGSLVQAHISSGVCTFQLFQLSTTPDLNLSEVLLSGLRTSLRSCSRRSLLFLDPRIGLRQITFGHGDILCELTDFARKAFKLLNFLKLIKDGRCALISSASYFRFLSLPGVL